MSSTRKVLLTILIALVVLVGGVVVAAKIWWSRHGEEALRQSREAMTTGRTFGRGSPAGRCVGEVLDRHERGEASFTSTIRESLFLDGCLQTADSLGAYCSSNPDQSITGSARWTLRLCGQRGLTDRYCTTTLQPLVKACRNPPPRPTP